MTMINKEVIYAMDKIINYMEADEKRNYEEYFVDDSSDYIDADKIATKDIVHSHIYYSVRILKEYLAKVHK